MSFSASHLIRRNGKYHFKMRVPPEFIPVFGADFIRKTLSTSDEKEAKRSAEIMTSKVRSSFDLIRAGVLSEEQTRTLVGSFKRIKRERPATSKKPLLLSDLIRLYTIENSPNWKPKTIDEFKAQFGVLLLVIGDGPVGGYSRERCLECRNALLIKGLAPKTVNKYIGLLSSLFKWGGRHEYVRSNPAEGMMLDIPRRPDKERKAYGMEDLQRVVDNLPIENDEQWKIWIPIIGMLSGMRREEICQLYPSDIRQVGDVWCFDINSNGDDKSLKTEASDRFVPVHSTLIRLGFIRFVETRKDCHNLWGFVKWKTQWGKQFGNWYSRFFNRKYITQDPLKCFHSLRHYAADHLKQGGFQEVLIAELLGHSNDSITTGRYGKKFLPPKLVEAVETLGAGINFRALE
jgi:integrase